MNNSLTIEQVNPVYLAFKEPGFHWGLFMPAMFFAILAMIGIPLNTSVCWVTIKYRSLLCHNNCILLALNSFFEIMHQLGHFQFLIITLSGINFYPLRLAFPIQSFSIIGVFAGSNQVALLSFDRLISVLAPLSYCQLNQRIYIFCHLLINFGINAIYFTQLIPAAKKIPEWPCTGFIADLFTMPTIGPILCLTGVIIISVTILAYLLVGIIVRQKLAEVSTERQQKIYHSLLLIVLINVATYFYGLFLHLLFKLSLLPLTPLQSWYLNLFNGAFFFNIGGMSNAPILYYNSKDYRRAYEKEFKKFSRLFRIICRRKQQSTIKIIPISNQILIK